MFISKDYSNLLGDLEEWTTCDDLKKNLTVFFRIKGLNPCLIAPMLLQVGKWLPLNNSYQLDLIFRKNLITYPLFVELPWLCDVSGYCLSSGEKI